MTEYESTHRAKAGLYKLLQKQAVVEADIKKYHNAKDEETCKLLEDRYNALNEKILEAAKVFVELGSD